jgi:predicted O-methyltransferase YrrM
MFQLIASTRWRSPYNLAQLVLSKVYGVGRRDRKMHAEWSARSRAYGDTIKNSDWIDFDHLGTAAPYRPTIHDSQMEEQTGFKKIMSAPLGRMGVSFLINLDIDGFLARDDALKIYEMAYHSAGDVLELGTHKGLSTSIIAEALGEADGGNLETVDIDAAANKVARANVGSRPFSEKVTFTIQDASKRMDKLRSMGRKFGFVLIDHWHGYDATYEAASRLRDLLKPGGYVLFHDFLDPGNSDPNHVYGVYQAVLDTLCLDPEFEFVCNSGCCGLFRRKP